MILSYEVSFFDGAGDPQHVAECYFRRDESGEDSALVLE